MNLYLFPEAASMTNGYGMAVDEDYRRLSPQNDDIIDWYTVLQRNEMLYLRAKDVVIKKNSFLSCRSVFNTLRRMDRTEVHYSDLKFLKNFDFDYIFCGDTIFYRALRKMFPNKQITVRFHNCFARILDRQKLINLKLDWQYLIKLQNMYYLEREIFLNPKVKKIFISDEDRDYYCSMVGKWQDSSVWSFVPNMKKAYNNRKAINYNNTIVWFGGIESHKRSSIKWFVYDVFPKIIANMPQVELHLWGRNTENYNNISHNVYGHGFYHGKGMPSEKCLYINPDIIGGGVKIKLISMIEAGVPFITTPFGFEGYNRNIVDSNYIHLVEMEDWTNYIMDIMS